MENHIGRASIHLASVLGHQKIKFKIESRGIAEIGGQRFLFRDSNSQFHSIYWKIFSPGYEEEIKWIIDKLPQDRMFIDCGANWGHHSIYAALVRKIDTIAIEPHPDSFQDLLDVTFQTKCKNIQPLNIAAGETSRVIRITQTHFESGTTSKSELNNNLRLKNHRSKAIYDMLRLKPMTFLASEVPLDDLATPNPVGLIKIDTEGTEFGVLLGAQKLIKKHRPYVIFEHHPNFQSTPLAQIQRLFSNHRYILKTFSRSDDTHEQFAVKDINPDDLHRNWNVIAVPAEDYLGLCKSKQPN